MLFHASLLVWLLFVSYRVSIIGRLGYDILSNGKDGLNSDVHDHHTLGTEVERKNLKSVGNEQAGETDIVEDAEEPDESNLGIASTSVGVSDTTIRLLLGGRSLKLGVLVNAPGEGPEDESEDHTRDGSEEKRTTSDLVDSEGSTNGDGQIEDGLSSREL